LTADQPSVEEQLAIARTLESEGRFDSALAAYSDAFERSAQDPVLASDIGRLALRLGEHAIAEQLFVIHLAADPASLDSRIHLAHALRELHRYDEAMAVLTPAIQDNPQEATLWAALGAVLTHRGRPAEALTFLDEALRLRPGAGALLYARGNALADLGDQVRAIADYAAAIEALPSADGARVRLAMALSKLAAGDLAGGWDDYCARLSPHSAKPVVFATDARPWAFDPDEPSDALRGRALMLFAEQGLGDEVMFANVVPDVIEALGPQGRLTLAVEARLAPLFARSFPDAAVVAHRTWIDDGTRLRDAGGAGDFDLWAPMAAPLRRFRRGAADFPDRPRFLTADPARVAHWRAVLGAQPGRKVGILWKSLKLHGERLRQFAPFDLWAPVLRAPGVTIVNLQYGDCADELAHAREAFGVEVWQPPGIDLKQDLDDVAALTCALDLTIGFANATINLAGACGAPTWLITPGASWTKLGTDRYPWYPQMRCFSAAQAGGWEAVMEAVAQALGEGAAA
jgi:tetratricopeptide (TPR) repeat protein